MRAADWIDEINLTGQPLVQGIARAVMEAIRSGALPEGAKLPPHRELAKRLGVNIGTVTRAYASVQKSGLAMADRRRGTMVRWDGRAEPVPQDLIDLTMNAPAYEGFEAELAAGLRRLADSPGMIGQRDYAPSAGTPHDRAMAVEWLARTGLVATPDAVALSAGAQHGLTTVLLALTRPGASVMIEALASPGLKMLASLLGLRLVGLPIDRDGLLPDAFDEACRRDTARILLTVPTLHNPTSTTMPVARREAIADVARRHGVMVIEDDVYSAFPASVPPPIASILPEQTILVTSFSKAIAPALRLGYIVSPPRWRDAVTAAIRATIWMASPLTAYVVANWVEDGTAARLVARHRQALAERHRIAHRALAGHDLVGVAGSPHLWLRLPDPWRGEEFRAACWHERIALSSADSFAVGQVAVPYAVRISLGGAMDGGTLDSALSTVARLLRSGPRPAHIPL